MMNEETREKSDAVFEVEHRHDNPVVSLKCAPVDKSIIYILYCVRKKKHPFTGYPAAKHQNTANLALQAYKKNH